MNQEYNFQQIENSIFNYKDVATKEEKIKLMIKLEHEVSILKKDLGFEVGA